MAYVRRKPHLSARRQVNSAGIESDIEIAAGRIYMAWLVVSSMAAHIAVLLN